MPALVRARTIIWMVIWTMPKSMVVMALSVISVPEIV